MPPHRPLPLSPIRPGDGEAVRYRARIVQVVRGEKTRFDAP
jgi:hypothetical protein